MFSSNGSQVASNAANYIEDVFSTYLYTGNGSTQTITNGIDLSGEGGLVWWKNRTNATGHGLIDTTRGIDYYLSSNTTDAQDGPVSYISSVSSTGYSIGAGTQSVNQSANNYVSWTFRKQPKFFDVVTYTGDGTSGRTISHNLGSVPGFIVVKSTSDATIWAGYHRSLGATKLIRLNTTDAATTNATMWNDTEPTDTLFSVGNAQGTNQSSLTYVAYLFAHNAGGFGLTGTDNVISCGSYTGTGTTPGPVVTLGYEPQWVMWKRTDAGTEQWHIRDVMRGMPVTASGQDLYADSASAGGNTTNEGLIPTATGFQVIGTNTNANSNGGTYIYIAIRRGPMKVPTSGTSVFAPTLGFAGIPGFQTGQPVDAGIVGYRPGYTGYPNIGSRLTGTGVLATPSTAAETTNSLYKWDYMNGWVSSNLDSNYIGWNFRRAPSTFDVVCYTGNATSGSTQTHNLGVAPEFMIVKGRSVNANWFVYSQALGATKYLVLNDTGGSGTISSVWNDTSPTSTQFTLGNAGAVNASGGTYVAYLWATNPGVTKVGSYTGTGTTQAIDCGFAAGARFVMVKATSTTGNWIVVDTARGLVSGNDPTLALNSTAAEVTTNDWFGPYSAGFELSSASGNLANTNGVSYIYFSVA